MRIGSPECRCTTPLYHTVAGMGIIRESMQQNNGWIARHSMLKICGPKRARANRFHCNVHSHAWATIKISPIPKSEELNSQEERR
jgi:hypothetical protein